MKNDIFLRNSKAAFFFHHKVVITVISHVGVYYLTISDVPALTQ